MFDTLFKNFSYENIEYFFTLDVITHYLSQLFMVVFFWCTLFGLDSDSALPFKGPIFQLVVIFVMSFVFGEVMSLFNLPPLLGMLITGFALGNAFELNIDKHLSSMLRQTALVIILLRAGLELDPNKIMHLSGVCFRLAFTPCIVETITIAISSNILLSLPIEWGFLLGFILAAVSPAVVVSGVLPLKEHGYGLDKGIPTILIASSSVDDILAISGVMICLRLVFDSDSPFIWILCKGPIEALIGVMYGILMGMILWYVPQDRQSVLGERQRLCILFLSALFLKFGSKLGDIESAGPLAALVTAFFAATDWRLHRINKPMQRHLKIFWTVFQPLLFGLIGTEVKINDLKSRQIGFAVICLSIGLTMRCLTAAAVVFGANLNLKEKLFVALAWMPKATVQAAVGPIALDIARDRGDDKNLPKAELVLTIAVMSIMLTAPLGSVAIALSGPKLLTKTDKSTADETKRSALKTDEDDDEDD